MDYHILREFADSWALLAMFTMFIGVILFAFRRGARDVHDDAARSVFRNEDRPAPDMPQGQPKESL